MIYDSDNWKDFIPVLKKVALNLQWRGDEYNNVIDLPPPEGPAILNLKISFDSFKFIRLYNKLSLLSEGNNSNSFSSVG